MDQLRQLLPSTLFGVAAAVIAVAVMAAGLNRGEPLVVALWIVLGIAVSALLASAGFILEDSRERARLARRAHADTRSQTAATLKLAEQVRQAHLADRPGIDLSLDTEEE